MTEKIKEAAFLTHLNSEHDKVRELCARIREGLSRKVETYRIRSYVDWFQENWIKPHFRLEEQFLISLLGKNARVKRALANHRRINRLLTCSCEDIKVLSLLEEEFSSHIRFEERILYKELLPVLDEQRLHEIEKHHREVLLKKDEWDDVFWE